MFITFSEHQSILWIIMMLSLVYFTVIIFPMVNRTRDNLNVNTINAGVQKFLLTFVAHRNF